VTRPVLQTEGAAGHRQPCRGPSVCTAHGGHDFARRLMLVRGKHQTWGAPASRRVFRLPVAGPAWRQITILWQQIARSGATARP